MSLDEAIFSMNSEANTKNVVTIMSTVMVTLKTIMPSSNKTLVK